jgi:SAM-dependent methyltransferase
VQWVTKRLLVHLWRTTFGVDARGSLGDVERLGLWESPTGLYFFDPPLEGDHAFYTALYAWLNRHHLFTAEAIREEFRIAAKRIPEGARVLDVGCGFGSFRRCVPEVDYTGLDPHTEVGIEGVRSQTLTEHLDERAGYYDAVCCFQVIEHVRDPTRLFAEMVEAAKPGGLLCVGVPHIPSAITRIPNFLINAPPHHLTWWTSTALTELAKSAGAAVETIETAPWGAVDSQVYWIERCSPFRCHDIHFRGAVRWHAAALTGFALGTLAFKLFGAPKQNADEGAGLLMIARKPR